MGDLNVTILARERVLARVNLVVAYLHTSGLREELTCTRYKRVSFVIARLDQQDVHCSYSAVSMQRSGLRY